MPSRITPGDKKVPSHREPEETNVPSHKIRDEEDELPVKVYAYAWGGEMVDPNSPLAVAKSAFDPSTGDTKFWLKRATSGPDKGFLYNPHSPAHSGSLTATNRLGNNQYEFRKATRESFQLYRQFIVEPHNNINLRAAERA